MLRDAATPLLRQDSASITSCLTVNRQGFPLTILRESPFECRGIPVFRYTALQVGVRSQKSNYQAKSQEPRQSLRALAQLHGFEQYAKRVKIRVGDGCSATPRPYQLRLRK